jgi:high frequency lysogenization protein
MELVKQTARTGRNDEMALRSALVSVFMVDADGILEVYGGLASLRLGLKALGRQLSEPKQVDPETARYASTLIYLEPLLTQDRGMTDTISHAIRDAKEIWDRSTERMDPEVFRLLATAYQQTVSTLKPRIMVAGEQRYLSDPQNANQIRTLLLAGIRSALLWRQAGGSKWRVLFLRSRMQKIVEELLHESNQTQS